MKNRPPEVDGRERTPEGVRYGIAMIVCVIMGRSLTAPMPMLNQGARPVIAPER